MSQFLSHRDTRAHRPGRLAGREGDIGTVGDVERRSTARSTAEKAIVVLEALAAHDGIGVREVARTERLDKSAVSRLLDQFVRLGVAERDPTGGRFRAGPRLFALGAAVHGRDTLWQAAEPILRELSGRFNETCYLATREGDEIVFRDKIDCDHHIRYVIDSGERGGLHAGAGGRAVLAGLPPAEVEQVLDRVELVRRTDRTLTDRDTLRRQVAEDRRRGYSLSMGERIVGGSAVAAPYFVAGGRCRGSIVFTCPDVRLDVARVPEIAEAVVGAARQLSARLGHRPSGAGEGGSDGGSDGMSDGERDGAVQA